MTVSQEMADLANKQIDAHFSIRPITVDSTMDDILFWLRGVRDDLPRYIASGAKPAVEPRTANDHL